MQQAISKDMASLPMRGQLNLVNRQKVDASIEWHRFHRADPVAWLCGDPFFLTGD